MSEKDTKNSVNNDQSEALKKDNSDLNQSNKVVKIIKVEQTDEVSSSNTSVAHVKKTTKKRNSKSTDDKTELSIDSTIQHLETVISNYKILNKKIHKNKNKIAELQKKTIRIKENKITIEEKVNQSENENNDIEKPIEKTNTITDSNLVKEITDNKYFIKNKTCNNIKKNVEKIQNNIASNTEKSASYIEPLYLSCKLLKTHISYTQSLESTVAAFDVQRELELQQDDANELIKMLVEHFDAIKDYQPLTETGDETTKNSETASINTVKEQSNNKIPAKHPLPSESSPLDNSHKKAS